MLELKERDFESFFAAPFAAYGSESPYVSPMRSDLARFLSLDNPLFESADDFTYFTALRDGTPVGRTTAHRHRASNRKFGWKRAYFGFFDVADDLEATTRLLEAVEGWAADHDLDEVLGNVNLTAMQQMGVLTGGFDRTPYTDMVYGPPHLPEHLEKNGYEPFFPMTTFETDLEAFDPESLLGPRQRDLLTDPGLTWRRLERRHLKQQMQDVRRVLNDGFAENPMFVPLTEEEIRFQSDEMLWIVDERIACLVYEGDEPIGTVVCIPDLNPFQRATRSRIGLTTPWHFLRHRLRRRRAVILFYSVNRSCHGRGLAGAMLYRVTSALKAGGYRQLGTTWIGSENGASLRQMEKLGATPLHQLHLFRKPLTGASR